MQQIFQILVTLVQGVSNTFPCSWDEAINFRRDHVGTPEQAVRSLVYMKYKFQTGEVGIVPPAPSSYATATGGPGSVYSPQQFYQAQQYASMPPPQMAHAQNVNGLPQQQMYPQVV